MDVVDKILEGALPKNVKIVRLVAVTQLNYRQPLGDKAWDAIRGLTDDDTVMAIAYLLGYSSAGADNWQKLLPY